MQSRENKIRFKTKHIPSASSKKECIPLLLDRLTNTSIHNFSGDRSLDKCVLSLGGKFIPPLRPLRISEITNSLLRLRRRLLIHFHVFEGPQKIPPLRLKIPSAWEPFYKLNENQVKVKTLFTNLIEYVTKKRFSNPNYDNTITAELKILRCRNDIKIVQTDKNLGLAILMTEDYHKLVTETLSNPVYEKLVFKEIDGLEWIQWKVTDRFKYIKQLFDEYELRFIEYPGEETQFIAIFHGLPKVHKNQPLFRLPLRPIVAGRPQQIQSRVSVVLSERLLPHLGKFKSILYDSTSLKNDIEFKNCKNRIFISIDFESLYTSIPLQDLYEKIKNCEILGPIKLRNSIIAILKFIFGNNFFIYCDDLYQQTDGIAMGTNVAPIIANLYLAIKFDENITQLHNLEIYRRYIDDGFIMYNGDVNSFESEILPLLQKFAYPIKITYECSTKEINYLDLTIFNHNDTIATKIFQKPLNKYAYIPFSSSHPRNTITGFIKGEILRYKRLSTLQEDFDNITNLFYHRLLARGYPKKFLNRIFLQALCPPLKQDGNNTGIKNMFNWVIRYSNQPKIIKFIQRELQMISENVLNINEDMIRTTFSSNPNVINLVVRSALSKEKITLINGLKEVVFAPDSQL